MEHIDAVKQLINLCHILMTSLVVVVGIVPLAFRQSAESRVPMAVAIIGGVLVSMLFALFVVPCVYSLFAPLEGKRKASSSSVISIKNP